MDYYFAVYECDEDGDELERLDNFDTKEEAIDFCNKQKCAHVVIMPPLKWMNDLSEWRHSGIPYDPFEVVYEHYSDKQKNNSIKSAFPGENPRDEYLKMMGRNMRENQATLTQGEFDDAMDNNGNFIRGFYKWDSDNHNWGCEVDVNLYLVVSYHTDGGGVFIRLIDTSSGKREVVTTRHIHFLDYDDVAKECIDIGEKMNEDFTEFFTTHF